MVIQALNETWDTFVVILILTSRVGTKPMAVSFTSIELRKVRLNVRGASYMKEVILFFCGRGPAQSGGWAAWREERGVGVDRTGLFRIWGVSSGPSLPKDLITAPLQFPNPTSLLTFNPLPCPSVVCSPYLKKLLFFEMFTFTFTPPHWSGRFLGLITGWDPT